MHYEACVQQQFLIYPHQQWWRKAENCVASLQGRHKCLTTRRKQNWLSISAFNIWNRRNKIKVVAGFCRWLQEQLKIMNVNFRRNGNCTKLQQVNTFIYLHFQQTSHRGPKKVLHLQSLRHLIPSASKEQIVAFLTKTY